MTACVCTGGGEGVAKGEEEEGRRGRGSSWIGNLHHAWHSSQLCLFSTAVLGKKTLFKHPPFASCQGNHFSRQEGEKTTILEIQKLYLIAFKSVCFIQADLVRNITVTWARGRMYNIIIEHHIYSSLITLFILDESQHHCTHAGQNFNITVLSVERIFAEIKWSMVLYNV